ncbi:GDSL-like Lipase/Acylhydrolase superfamily protein [Striga asiatica]|uniref:GDSL-like Lipase/Acylhydrolase superfamily protein n=1 Tax=Striga asiatica TaxID=4170 RepID=A0A5A7Q9C7_STRAF|nr:GDSL-like Lipase/Acylhydrolase superfamily protein [Striga asiatica]
MDRTQYTVTLKEFRQFHSIDRALYCLLTFDLLRDPTESLNVLALWLWLERLGFYNFVSRALSLPPFLVDQLADEAVECLNCLDPQSPFFPDAIMTEIPLTHSLAGRRDISLQFFIGRGNEVQTLVREVCTPLVADLKDAGPGTGPARGVESDRDERTVFVTFSKGYPVGEGELRGFLAGVLGGEDRVETLLFVIGKSLLPFLQPELPSAVSSGDFTVSFLTTSLDDITPRCSTFFRRLRLFRFRRYCRLPLRSHPLKPVSIP